MKASSEYPTAIGEFLGQLPLALQISVAIALSPAAAWVIARIYEQLTKRLESRRAFAAKTTDRVVELLTKHYWALANTTGTFGVLLQNYLRELELTLFVHYGDRTRSATESVEDARLLTAACDEVANRAARDAFPALVRMVGQFDQFQFRGSQTYLLPDRAAGPRMRRLYNLMLVSLPGDDFLSRLREAIEQHAVAASAAETKQADASGKGGAPEANKAADRPASAASSGIAGTWLENESNLTDERKRFVNWLRRSLAEVSEAACAARTFEAVMHAEMDKLTDAFFGEHPGLRQRSASAGNARVSRGLQRSEGLEISVRPLWPDLPVLSPAELEG